MRASLFSLTVIAILLLALSLTDARKIKDPHHAKSGGGVHAGQSTCDLTGTWTGILAGGAGDSGEYYLRSTPAGFMVMAVKTSSWGHGTAMVDASHSVTLTLDFTTKLNGNLTNDCQSISWDNHTVWKKQVQVHTVYLVTMNHLDVGYNGIPMTGYINNVLNVYFKSHIPRALALQQTMRGLNLQERFIWTAHPWLLDYYINCPDSTLADVKLLCPSADEVAMLEDAMRRGDVTWHAGPFNLQPENMDSSLFEYGLSIAERLDTKYNIKRVTGRSLSQRDVPGMTRGVIPLLTKHGVTAITVGENGGAPHIGGDSANVFLWRDEASNTDIPTMYHPGGYGDIDRFNDAIILRNGYALVTAFRSDNQGPPSSVQEVLETFMTLKKEFPGANIVPATFEMFAEQLNKPEVRSTLPVVTKEIGDVWIQGIASDPVKEQVFREISRARTECLAAGHCSMSDQRMQDMSRFLIKVPEHTWGLPSENDNSNWSNDLFHRYRADTNFVNCENAWIEQRQFNDYAITALGDHPLATTIRQRVAALAPKVPSTSGMAIVNVGDVLRCDNMSITFGKDGGLSSFFDGFDEWVTSPSATLARFQYATLNSTDFDYMRGVYGGDAGYSKNNSTCTENGCANPEDRRVVGEMQGLYWDKVSCRAVAVTVMDVESVTKYGAPQVVFTEVIQLPKTLSLSVSLTVSNKTVTRLPEMLHLDFKPSLRKGLTWSMDKLGTWISPEDVLTNGAQYQHAVWQGIRYTDDQGHGLYIDTLDAPLVAPITSQPVLEGKWFGTPTALPVPLMQLPEGSVIGMSSSIYNNCMWSDG